MYFFFFKRIDSLWFDFIVVRQYTSTYNTISLQSSCFAPCHPTDRQAHICTHPCTVGSSLPAKGDVYLYFYYYNYNRFRSCFLRRNAEKNTCPNNGAKDVDRRQPTCGDLMAACWTFFAASPICTCAQRHFALSSINNNDDNRLTGAKHSSFAEQSLPCLVTRVSSRIINTWGQQG